MSVSQSFPTKREQKPCTSSGFVRSSSPQGSSTSRVGLTEGFDDGSADGPGLGAPEGDVDGDDVGPPDGLALGEDEGASVGVAVGARDGDDEGLNDGCGVGCPLGVLDGVAVGSRVGLSEVGDDVGSGVTHMPHKMGQRSWNSTLVHAVVITAASCDPMIAHAGASGSPSKHLVGEGVGVDVGPFEGDIEGLRLGLMNSTVGEVDGEVEGARVTHPPHDTGHRTSISFSEHPPPVDATLAQNPG